MLNYGMTPEDYETILIRQNGGCAICRTKSSRRLVVDHCHETGMVRGLLCDACNKGLGNFAERPATMRAAADFVEIARSRGPATDTFRPRPARRARLPPRRS